MSRTVYDSRHYCSVTGETYNFQMVEGKAAVCRFCDAILGMQDDPYWDEANRKWSKTPVLGNTSAVLGFLKNITG